MLTEIKKLVMLMLQLGQIPAPALHSKDWLAQHREMQHRLISFIPVPNAAGKGWKCTSKGGQ